MVRLFSSPQQDHPPLPYFELMTQNTHVPMNYMACNNKPLFSHSTLFIYPIESRAVALCGNERVLQHLQHYQCVVAFIPKKAFHRLSWFWCTPTSDLWLSAAHRNALLLPESPDTTSNICMHSSWFSEEPKMLYKSSVCISPMRQTGATEARRR